jgi:hypothetical protein
MDLWVIVVSAGRRASDAGHSNGAMLSIGMVTGHHQISVIRLGLFSQVGALTKARAANLSGLARVNPVLKLSTWAAGQAPSHGI